MQIARIILFLGIWTAILPYLGFPYLLKNILFSVTGLIFVYVSLVMYGGYRKLRQESRNKKFENFSENKVEHSIDSKGENTIEENV
jgi:hypothetical protein